MEKPRQPVDINTIITLDEFLNQYHTLSTLTCLQVAYEVLLRSATSDLVVVYPENELDRLRPKNDLLQTPLEPGEDWNFHVFVYQTRMIVDPFCLKPKLRKTPGEYVNYLFEIERYDSQLNVFQKPMKPEAFFDIAYGASKGSSVRGTTGKELVHRLRAVS